MKESQEEKCTIHMVQGIMEQLDENHIIRHKTDPAKQKHVDLVISILSSLLSHVF